jgi:hypothetical protein
MVIPVNLVRNTSHRGAERVEAAGSADTDISGVEL